MGYIWNKIYKWDTRKETRKETRGGGYIHGGGHANGINRVGYTEWIETNMKWDTCGVGYTRNKTYKVGHREWDTYMAWETYGVEYGIHTELDVYEYKVRYIHI